METKNNHNNLELLKYLWEEYKYRHDLIWRLLFRFTGTVALLGVIPYAYSDIPKKTGVGNWIIFLPVIALVLSIIGYFWMRFELNLFKFVDQEYHQLQSKIFRNKEFDKQKYKKFRYAVLIYYLSLIILSLLNLVFIVWLAHKN